MINNYTGIIDFKVGKINCYVIDGDRYLNFDDVNNLFAKFIGNYCLYEDDFYKASA